ncbi:MAG: tetratricopeptide repeat protein [Terracidiphilus sp.]
MGRACILLLAFLSLTLPESSPVVAQDKQHHAACAQWEKIQIPAADLPAPQDRQTPAPCNSQDLYFGFGRPIDLVGARKCAYLEREEDNAPIIGGPGLLMMIYANGKGASRNFDLALKFACEFNGAPEGNQGQINHLLRMRKEHWTGDNFSLCDDASSGYMAGVCAGLQEEIHQAPLARKLGRIAEGWTPAQKTAFAGLEKAASNFIEASSDNESDMSGTDRDAYVFQRQGWLRNGFVAAVERSEKGQFPSFSMAEFKKADEELNAVYAGIQSAKPGSAGMGTVTPQGIRTAQRAWLQYEEAWVKFGLVKYPGVKPESWRAWLTFDRILMLHFIPSPGAPEWQAFQPFLPWRYHYELGEELGGDGGDVGEYREAIRLKPDWVPLHEALGGALAAKGDWDGAIQEYREAVRLDPNNADAHQNLGFAFEKKKDWDNEVKEYREVVRLKPDDDSYRFSIGFALASKKDWDGAIQAYRQALRLSPHNTGYLSHLGDAFAGKNDWDGAIQAYREVIRLEPNDADAHYDLGMGLEGKGEDQSALDEYRKAQALDPKNETIRSACERLLEKSER